MKRPKINMKKKKLIVEVISSNIGSILFPFYKYLSTSNAILKIKLAVSGVAI